MHKLSDPWEGPCASGGGVIRFTGIHCNLIRTHVFDYEYKL
jgi:hypothetical protein